MLHKIYTNIYYKNRTVTKYFKNLKVFTKKFKSQYGGSNLKIKYDNAEYIFEKNEDDNIYILYSADKKENTCVTVIIDKELKNANISTIDSFDKCISNKDKVGTTLLKITLKMLEKYKNKFNIEVITLSDQSYKKCNGKEIDMMTLSILTTGETWYGHYGFRPIIYKNNNAKLDKIENDKYNENIKIMNKLKIKDINLIKYFEKIKSFTPEQLDYIKNIIKNDQEVLVKDFLKRFLQEFDKTCVYFYKFYRQLYKDIKLHTLKTYFGKFI